MSVVYKAKHRRDGRIVAIKEISRQVQSTKAGRKRFIREVQIASKLKHPNIVNTFDADAQDRALFMVMEYVDGEDLGLIMQKHGPLPISVSVDYILQAAYGLAYAHDQGV